MRHFPELFLEGPRPRGPNAGDRPDRVGPSNGMQLLGDWRVRVLAGRMLVVGPATCLAEAPQERRRGAGPSNERSLAITGKVAIYLIPNVANSTNSR